MGIVKFPFGEASTIALTATGDQNVTVINPYTIIDGDTVKSTGHRTLNLTIDPSMLSEFVWNGTAFVQCSAETTID